MPVIDAPVHAKATTLAALYRCVEHPAFRIGFLDAQDRRPFDHDLIMQRILSETPAGALKRIRWRWSGVADIDIAPGLFEAENLPVARAQAVALAQWRYEEGRTLFLEHGIRCKAWGHPDYPPAQVREFLITRLQENREANDGPTDPAEQAPLRP